MIFPCGYSPIIIDSRLKAGHGCWAVGVKLSILFSRPNHLNRSAFHQFGNAHRFGNKVVFGPSAKTTSQVLYIDFNFTAVNIGFFGDGHGDQEWCLMPHPNFGFAFFHQHRAVDGFHGSMR